MFFSGDPSTRKRVALGGRSNKERDRQKLLEQTRLERDRRSWLRKQTTAAIKIQKFFRGRKVVQAARLDVRDRFYRTFGKDCEKVDRKCFGPDSVFLQELLFFLSAKDADDFSVLLKTCLLLQQYTEGDLMSLFAGMDYISNKALVDYRVKQLVYICVQAIYHNRYKLRDQSCQSMIVLLGTVALLIGPKMLWACKTVGYLVEKKAFMLFREIVMILQYIGFQCLLLQLSQHVVFVKKEEDNFWLDRFFIYDDVGNYAVVYILNLWPHPRCLLIHMSRLIDKCGYYCKHILNKECTKSSPCREFVSSLECLLGLLIPHINQKQHGCLSYHPEWSFSSQLLTIPFLWKLFPQLKEVFATQGLTQHFIHHMALSLKNQSDVLPKDLSLELPGSACLLGNTLETASVALSQPDCSFDMAIDLAGVLTFLLESLPSLKRYSPEDKDSSTTNDDDVMWDDEPTNTVLNKDLEQQIFNAITSRFVLQLVNVLFGRISSMTGLNYGPDGKVVAAVGAACAFLHVAFNTFQLEQILIVLAYRTELVPVLWNFMKWCHENDKWSSLSEHSEYFGGDAPGWLLPLSVFCPVYKLMLMLTDNEEFYEQEKPLSLKDIRILVIMLRQALWQPSWVAPSTTANNVRSSGKHPANTKSRLEILQSKVILEASGLLSQLLDWNNRRQFTPSSDFHADGVNESFISQATLENTRAHDILKQAPFLIPFTSRVKIFTSQLATHRQRSGSQAAFIRNRFRIRRDHILEDAYNQMSALSEEDLRGPIRVTFINEFGVEEAGIDGGGIFKDFMENITRAAFDVQYGLFKETSDHLLYPNPGSGFVHEQHLQFFHFLGTLLAKAMYEGILVDIPFATFFLSKLKQKHNYLNDLPSLDPELYRHLIFLKHYDGDVSELELYFVIINNEYGEQREEELLPGGKNRRVTNENVITFVRLVANHRLNFQIRQQSIHFLRGFQQLIQKEWIDMFNEHELQLLISGSLESLDVDDLRSYTNYAGGYNKDHYVIEMFWEVLKSFSLENQKKFLKFVTGCSRGPLLGFRYLEPAFCIQRAGGTVSDESIERLPTSATCMNLLKLPPYQSKEQLETKLMYAISADAGFDLS